MDKIPVKLVGNYLVIEQSANAVRIRNRYADRDILIQLDNLPELINTLVSIQENRKTDAAN